MIKLGSIVYHIAARKTMIILGMAHNGCNASKCVLYTSLVTTSKSGHCQYENKRYNMYMLSDRDEIGTCCANETQLKVICE